jgi:hypothetical protein
MHRSCRLRDSQSRAAQGRSVAADGASLGIDRVALMNFVAAVAEKGARHASQSEFRSLRGKLARSSAQ